MKASSAPLKIDYFILEVQLLKQTRLEMTVKLAEVVHLVVIVLSHVMTELGQEFDHK